MPMMDPPHPGEIVREECLASLGLSVIEGARALGVPRQTLDNLLDEKVGLTPEMALRLEKAFGSSAEMWMRLQISFDLAAVRKREAEISVERYAASRPDGTSPPAFG